MDITKDIHSFVHSLGCSLIAPLCGFIQIYSSGEG